MAEQSGARRTADSSRREASPSNPASRKSAAMSRTVSSIRAAEAKKAEAAPAPAKKTIKAKKAATVAVEEKKEAAPAKKPRAKKEAAPAKTSKPKKATSSKQTAIVIQSPMGGEITTEDILAKVGDVDKAYVRVDQNAIYWIKGEKSGAVNIW